MKTLEGVSMPPDTGPSAPTKEPTQTSAKEGALDPGLTKEVVMLTLTVVVFLNPLTTKAPALPAVPHVPDVVDPFTDWTEPNAPCAKSGGAITGAMTTLVAVTVSPATDPSAPTSEPTQTLANEGELTPGSVKAVVVLTLTV
jgi:hypothetical protein